MEERKLETVSYRPNPAKATVIDCVPGFKGPYFAGEGDENLVCGRCRTLLVRGHVIAYLTLYVCCPECGTYNLVDGFGGGATA